MKDSEKKVTDAEFEKAKSDFSEMTSSAKANTTNTGLQRSIEKKTKAVQSGKTIRK